MSLPLLGLAAVGLAALVRASPWPAAWLARKPLSCVACMAGHASWVVLLLGWASGIWAWPGLAAAALAWLAMTGGGAVLLAQTGMFVQPFGFEPAEPPPISSEDPHGP